MRGVVTVMLKGEVRGGSMSSCWASLLSPKVQHGCGEVLC